MATSQENLTSQAVTRANPALVSNEQIDWQHLIKAVPRELLSNVELAPDNCFHCTCLPSAYQLPYVRFLSEQEETTRARMPRTNTLFDGHWLAFAQSPEYMLESLFESLMERSNAMDTQPLGESLAAIFDDTSDIWAEYKPNTLFRDTSACPANTLFRETSACPPNTLFIEMPDGITVNTLFRETSDDHSPTELFIDPRGLSGNQSSSASSKEMPSLSANHSANHSCHETQDSPAGSHQLPIEWPILAPYSCSKSLSNESALSSSSSFEIDFRPEQTVRIHQSHPGDTWETQESTRVSDAEALRRLYPGGTWDTQESTRVSDVQTLRQLRSFSRIDISSFRRLEPSNMLAAATRTASSRQHNSKFLAKRAQNDSTVIRMGCVSSDERMRIAGHLRHLSHEDMGRQLRAAEGSEREDIRFLPIAVATLIFVILLMIFLCYWLH